MTYQIRHAVRVLGIGCLFALLGCGDLSGASLWAQGGAPQKHKVLVCHIPQGNMENAHEIWIAESAVPAHLDHGDLLGACPMVFACTEQGIRDAIAYGGGPNFFDCDGPTVVPTEAEIIIDNDVILNGEGDLIVDAGGAASVEAGEVAPEVNGAHRVFSIPEGFTAELIGFTVKGGATAEAGGGILNAGILRLTESVVTLNAARFGGGLRNESEGHADLIDTIVSNNFATQAAGGISNRLERATMSLSGCTINGNTAAGNVGGIANGGTMTVSDTIVSGNAADAEGGGILNAGTLSVTSSTVTGNSGDIGGGIQNVESGVLNIANSTASDNTALRFGGGLHNQGQMEVIDSVLFGNEAGVSGGGIGTWPEGALMTLTRTAVSGNVTGGSGGGIRTVGMATLNETTISGNRAGQMGGGVSSYGTTTLNDSHVSANTSGGDGGGIMVLGGSATLNKTAVSGNECDNFGGGIQNVGTVVLNDSFVSENIARVNAGGLANGDTGVVALNNSTVSGNTAAFFGGALLNAGSMTVTSTTVSQNLSGDGGGGIINQDGGTLAVLNSAVSDNATTVGTGGGIHNGGTMTLTGSTAEGNTATHGGGLNNAFPGSMTVVNSTVSENTAAEDGGGIRNEEAGTLVVNRTTVSSNAAGTWTGGIRNYGFAQIIDTTVSNNIAVNGRGGIANRPSGNMTITGVTVWENIIANAGAMTVTNTTVSTNEAGIANLDTGSMSMVSATVSGVRNDGAMTVRNNIIDGDCQLTAPLESFGGNIESPGNTCTLIPPFDLFNVQAAQLGLGPLQDNGGPTWTRALLPGSFAIDSVEACVNAAGFPLLVDQRGAPRPYGPACDSGAFELGAVPLPRDLCVNDADRAVYESLEYIDGGGNPSTCTDAASSIAADCVFGSPLSTPPLAGCPAEVEALIACDPNCSPDVIAAFDQCVADCTEGATGLSTECAGCYGGWAGCGAQTCVPECAAGATQPLCTDCLFAAGCTGLFDACSGLPGDIDCGTGGTGGLEYAQDFESLNQASPTALGDDGWLVFGQVVDGSGVLKFDYGPFPAPNGTPGFSSIVTGEGGPDQGAQQLVVYNDYNCCDPNQGHRNGTDRVTSLVFQEPFTLGNRISADDVGKTLEFSFDAKRGNINDPTGSSTALAFIQTVDPTGFAQTNFVSVDMTNLPAGTWDRYSISLTIDAGLVGQYLEFGFSSTASNFDPSGVFYDNILVVL